MSFRDWWHHLLDPHCELCHRCLNCEYLKEQLDIEKQFNKVLVDKLTIHSPESVPVQTEDKELIKPRFVPWRARRQMLEAEDARAAQVMKQKQQEIKTAIIAPADDPDVKALEAEMEIIAKERGHAN